MTDLNQFQNFYLMGIKGVAMTAMVQLLLDAGKNVAGCDVEDEFVTAEILKKLDIKIDIGFDHNLPDDIECVIYSAAHQGIKNSIVQSAKKKDVATISHAQALAYFFNQKQGIAVCGVGGKTTVSSMITWILENNGLKPSFSVGAGKILGLDKTGQWNNNSDLFVSEADEYMMQCCEDDEESSQLYPRFHYMKPATTVCTNLEFDHPDVYQNLEHTQQIFGKFFEQIQNEGNLIINQDNDNLVNAVNLVKEKIQQKNIAIKTYSKTQEADAQISNIVVKNQTNQAQIDIDGKQYNLELKIPGDFNLMNAAAAVLACQQHGVSIEKSLESLKKFQGTQRRFEFVGQKNGVYYYDDYAHHPHELIQTIEAFKQWHPNARRVVAFQSHTFSRTKALKKDFVQALATADELILLDIFPSARETQDDSISSDLLIKEIKQVNPNIKAQNLHNVKELAQYCRQNLSVGDALITIGAGNIYEAHDLI